MTVHYNELHYEECTVVAELAVRDDSPTTILSARMTWSSFGTLKIELHTGSFSEYKEESFRLVCNPRSKHRYFLKLASSWLSCTTPLLMSNRA